MARFSSPGLGRIAGNELCRHADDPTVPIRFIQEHFEPAGRDASYQPHIEVNGREGGSVKRLMS